MANIIDTGASGYQTGSIDSATTLVNGLSPRDAKHVNGVASAAVQIETILGVGTDLKGSAADLVARLAVEHNADGSQKTLPVTKGGTGVTTLTDGGVLVGNNTGNVQAIAVPTTPKVLTHSGGAGIDPVWGSGLIYQGPSSIGTGSTRSLEVFTSANINPYSGIHFYDGAVTLNNGHTLTCPAGRKRIIIISNTSITINGTITAAGAGGEAGAAGSGGGTGNGGNGGPGTDQPGGVATGGGSVGYAMINGCFLTGGTGQITGSNCGLLANPLGAMGGGGGAGASGDGGGNPGGAGGAGGGSIVLIAPNVTLASTAVLNTSGSNGGNGTVGFTNGGGGGGGGNVYIITRSYTDSGATFTMTGGSGGSGNLSGSAGQTGVKQILIYA